MNDFKTIQESGCADIKLWTQGVPVEDRALQQLQTIARLPFIFNHLAVMPDVHAGKGSTVGSVIPTIGAVIPAAVGVDIGCGMMAVQTDLSAADLPSDLRGLRGLREQIERKVPHGRTSGHGGRDKGSWADPPAEILAAWDSLAPDFARLVEKYPVLAKTNNRNHLGTLGTGNHFIEVCLDEENRVWVMLHSGSRGVGNAIGGLFIRMAQDLMQEQEITLEDRDLAYFREGTTLFDDYMDAVHWAQTYAWTNRRLMMDAVLSVLSAVTGQTKIEPKTVVHCHHNYVQREQHFGQEILVTRKGAVSAHKGELGIIPGSMGVKSYIVEGLGEEESFCSCSHGAGRAMSRTAAKQAFTVDDQIRTTAHVECRKDAGVIDEIPLAYKDIDAVMQAQKSLVRIRHQLRQVICVKG